MSFDPRHTREICVFISAIYENGKMSAVAVEINRELKSTTNMCCARDAIREGHLSTLESIVTRAVVIICRDVMKEILETIDVFAVNTLKRHGVPLPGKGSKEKTAVSVHCCAQNKTENSSSSTMPSSRSDDVWATCIECQSSKAGNVTSLPLRLISAVLSQHHFLSLSSLTRKV